MINWKTTIGVTLFILASIQFLLIKDRYHPHRSIQIDQLFSMGGFMLTVALAGVLFVMGLRRSSRG